MSHLIFLIAMGIPSSIVLFFFFSNSAILFTHKKDFVAGVDCMTPLPSFTFTLSRGLLLHFHKKTSSFRDKGL